MKSFYRKLRYFAIPLMVLLVGVTAFAGTSTLDVNQVFSVIVNTPTNLPVSAIYDSEYDENTHTSFVDFSFNLMSTVRANYSTALYSNGRLSFNINVPISLPSGFIFRGYDFTVDSQSTEDCYVVVHSSYFNSGVLNFLVSVCCDNTYLGVVNSYFGNVSFNINIHTSTTIDFLPTSTMGTISNANIVSAGNSLSTSVHPVTTGGMGGVISDAVLFGLQQYNINDNLSALASLLATINQTNTTMYNQIISQLVANAQNDNRLMSGLQSLLTNYMVYENKDLAEMMYRYVYVLFPSFMEAGQSEADEANANATSMASNMDDVAASLEVARPDISSDLAIANNAITPDIVSGQGDLFFWLRGETLLVTIVVVSVSIGLMGFILYGKGGA